jgi:hypothetical protein
MDKNDEYRRLAAEAQERADRIVNAADKESWLKIALQGGSCTITVGRGT